MLLAATEMVRLNLLSEDEKARAFEKAGSIIRSGGLVAFPTETVYGLGANAMDADAAARIYAAKKRQPDNPLIAHIADREMLSVLAADVPPAAEILMDTWWPGPLTLIFHKRPQVPHGTTGGLDTVAVRMPDHPDAVRLIRAAGVPIAAPSANLSGRPSPTTADDTMEDMDGRIDMILDGGSCQIGIESTIVDVTEEIPMILRPGYITYEMLKDRLGEVRIDKPLDPAHQKDFKPKAPGQKYTHYAPKAPMFLVKGDKAAVVYEIRRLAELAESEGKRVGILCTDETKESFDRGLILCLGSRNNLDSVAHNLFHLLREFDEADVDLIYSEAFPDNELGRAVMNRMIKAAGYKEIIV